jgi:hypothetical protein
MSLVISRLSDNHQAEEEIPMEQNTRIPQIRELPEQDDKGGETGVLPEQNAIFRNTVRTRSINGRKTIHAFFCVSTVARWWLCRRTRNLLCD